MKNFKKFTAFVLALCMLFSLSVAAFAAEADVHTVYDSAPGEEIATQFRQEPVRRCCDAEYCSHDP